MIEDITEYNRLFYGMYKGMSDEELEVVRDDEVELFITKVKNFEISRGCPTMCVVDCDRIFGQGNVPLYKNGDLSLDGNCVHKKNYLDTLIPEDIRDCFLETARNNGSVVGDCAFCWTYNYYIGLKVVNDRAHFWKIFKEDK